MRTDLPSWLTEEHLRQEGEMRKFWHENDGCKTCAEIDSDTERQIAELREVRAAERNADAP